MWHRQEWVNLKAVMFEAAAMLGAPREQGILKLNLAALYEDVDRFDDALRAYDEAMPLVHEADERYVEAVSLIDMAGLLRKLGRVDEGKSCRRRGLAIAAEIEAWHLACAAHVDEAVAYNVLGQYDEALTEVERAEEMALKIEDDHLDLRATLGEADVLMRTGDALLGLDRRNEVPALWQRAIALWRDLGDERAAQLAVRLAELEQPGW